MTQPVPNRRRPEASIDPMFLDRWSPRAFLPDPIPEHQLKSLFEAARWAPSCNNEQPWLFIYATTPEDRERFGSILNRRNQRWALRAPVLMFVLTRRHFGGTEKLNRYAPFDAGSAWMSLALQARRLDLYAHGMAGFDLEKAYEVLGVPRDQYEVMAAIALGRHGDPSQLPPDLQEREAPSERKPLAEVAREGHF